MSGTWRLSTEFTLSKLKSNICCSISMSSISKNTTHSDWTNHSPWPAGSRDVSELHVRLCVFAPRSPRPGWSCVFFSLPKPPHSLWRRYLLFPNALLFISHELVHTKHTPITTGHDSAMSARILNLINWNDSSVIHLSKVAFSVLPTLKAGMNSIWPQSESPVAHKETARCLRKTFISLW